MLQKISEIIQNIKFSLIFVLRKISYSVNCRKSRKYDISVEPYYKNVVFHVVWIPYVSTHSATLMWLPTENFDLTKVANDKGKQPKWKLTLNKPWNWSNCTKLAVSASRTHGLIAQSVTLSERISVVAGSNPTQANILKLLQKIVQWWIPYIVAHSVTLVITYRKVRLNKRGHWRRQTA